MDVFEKARELFYMKGKLLDAYQLILELDYIDEIGGDFNIEAIMYKSKLKKLYRDSRRDLITINEFNLELNKLKYKFNEFLNDLEEEYEPYKTKKLRNGRIFTKYAYHYYLVANSKDDINDIYMEYAKQYYSQVYFSEGWFPFYKRNQKGVEDLEVAISELLTREKWVPRSDYQENIYKKNWTKLLEKAKENGEIVVIILDPFSLDIPKIQEMVSVIIEKKYWNCAIFAPLCEQVEENIMTKLKVITDQVLKMPPNNGQEDVIAEYPLVNFSELIDKVNSTLVRLARRRLVYANNIIENLNYPNKDFYGCPSL